MNLKPIVILLFIIYNVAACLPPAIQIKPDLAAQQQQLAERERALKNKAQTNVDDTKFRQRSKLPLNRFQYEGSLWKDESSWGNFMRDNRARFPGDVLTIKEVQGLFPKDPPVAANNTPDQNSTDQEHLNIQRSIVEISARVVSVFKNGTLAVYGEKIEYRNNNNIKFTTVIKGVVRPEDITNNNEVPAIKLARAEIKTSRRVKREELLRQAAARKANEEIEAEQAF